MNEENNTQQTLKDLRDRSPWNTPGQLTRSVNRAFNPCVAPGKAKKPKPKSSGVGRRIPVRCIETGEIYPSANAASAAIGLASNAVTCALLRKRKGIAKLARAAGKTWEYVITATTVSEAI